MNFSRTILAATVLLASGAGFAQTTTTATTPSGGHTAADIQRNVNQQNRIEQGLKSGQLSTQEAAQLEREQTHIDKMEQRDLANGPMTAQEQAQLKAAQGKMSNDIRASRHNSETGNANSASAKHMEADVQHNVYQQARVENGVKNGTLNNSEVANMENGQSRVNRAEAVNGKDGTMSAKNQAMMRKREHDQSRRIHNDRSNGNH